jgi:DNA mismatch endonuclease (patch repair protein)
MAYIVDAETRSKMMAGIRGKNTRPEIRVRNLLHHRGFRYRLHVGQLPGKPDVVLPKYHAAIFVHGCFWHGHNCPLFKLPQTRQEFWENKITRNRKNDKRAIKGLLADNWRVATVWECAMRGRGKLSDDIVAQRLEVWIKGGSEQLVLSSVRGRKI